MKAPADAIAREMTEAEENRAMDFILKGSKIVIGEGRQPNQPKWKQNTSESLRPQMAKYE